MLPTHLPSGLQLPVRAPPTHSYQAHSGLHRPVFGGGSTSQERHSRTHVSPTLVSSYGDQNGADMSASVALWPLDPPPSPTAIHCSRLVNMKDANQLNLSFFFLQYKFKLLVWVGNIQPDYTFFFFPPPKHQNPKSFLISFDRQLSS